MIEVNKRSEEILLDFSKNGNVDFLINKIFAIKDDKKVMKEGTRFAELYNLNKSFSTLDWLNFFKGEYVVVESFKDSIEFLYKKNRETACTTPNISEQWRCNGFNEAVRLLNKELFLELELEEF